MQPEKILENGLLASYEPPSHHYLLERVKGKFELRIASNNDYGHLVNDPTAGAALSIVTNREMTKIVLVIDRKFGDQSRWKKPGGAFSRQEGDKSRDDTADRETNEETGLHPVEQKLIFNFVSIPKDPEKDPHAVGVYWQIVDDVHAHVDVGQEGEHPGVDDLDIERKMPHWKKEHPGVENLDEHLLTMLDLFDPHRPTLREAFKLIGLMNEDGTFNN